MVVDIVFEEVKTSFDADFSELYQISDDRYKEGYNDGALEYSEITRGLLSGTLKEFRDDKLTQLRRGAFIYNSTLTVVELPKVKTISANVFTQCSSLQRASFPQLTSIGSDAFSYCSSMTYCDIGNAASLSSWVFTSCSSLQALIIRKADSICKLNHINSIDGNAIAKGIGFVYVPDHLIEQYKSATNWSTYASQIKPISELEG